MKIQDLKNKDKPRERLIEHGPKALSDVELLAILIGSGTKQADVFEIATKILNQYKLTELKDLSYKKIIQLAGIKQAKGCQLLACFELARRAVKKDLQSPSLETSYAIYNYVYDEIYLENEEVAIILFLDCKLRPLYKYIHRNNNVSSVEIPVKKIIQLALEYHAYGIVLIHNHPSGDVSPSTNDLLATFDLKKLLGKLDIVLLDHLVISSEKYYSMNEHGILTDDNEYTSIGDYIEEIN